MGNCFPMERTAEIISDVFGQGVSEGFLASLTLRTSEKLVNTEAAIRDAHIPGVEIGKSGFTDFH